MKPFFPLALEDLLIALKGAGNCLLIRGFILPQVERNSSSCCYYWEETWETGIEVGC